MIRWAGMLVMMFRWTSSRVRFPGEEADGSGKEGMMTCWSLAATKATARLRKKSADMLAECFGCGNCDNVSSGRISKVHCDLFYTSGICLQYDLACYILLVVEEITRLGLPQYANCSVSNGCR